MQTNPDLSTTIDAIGIGPRGPKVGAFFDVDDALLAGRLRGGGRTWLPLPGVRTPVDPLQELRGTDQADALELGRKHFLDGVASRVYFEAREVLAAHQRKGHTVVLTSSASDHEVAPLAEALGADDVICTEAEVVDGRLTGSRVGAVCAGEARAGAVASYAKDHRIGLARSHAYVSEDGEAPLLHLVGNPHVVNPGRELEGVAASAGWPVLTFDSRGRPDPETLLRSIAAYSTLLPSMLDGVAMGLLNRDRKKIAQYGVATYVERLFALTGVTLRVQGEKNLWSHRPAVFIYNHRSNFDPYVALKLVHRDWGSVGKKEIAGPLTPVMKWLLPNVAFVDRSNTEKALESLQPVTELLSDDVSVLVAPEGTRSRTGELGRFKKGPFRMAMEAGVPIVPIVIRNADSVTSRGGAIIRKGTVDVAVLAPVEVTGWVADDLDERIAEVRQSFIETLAAWPKG